MLLRAKSSKGKVKAFVLPNTPPHSYDAPNKGSVRVGFHAHIPRGKSKILTVELVPIN